MAKTACSRAWASGPPSAAWRSAVVTCWLLCWLACLPGLLGHPELGLLADSRGRVLMGHADELGERAGIVRERQVEGKLLAKSRVGVLAGERLDGDEAVVSALVGKPEGRGLADLRELAGRGELRQRGHGQPASGAAKMKKTASLAVTAR